MRHCTPDELLDVVEGARTGASMPHLAVCASCRQQMMEVRAVMAEVREVPVPEPSSVQWARLSARVRNAVASELERPRTPGWQEWLGRQGWPGRAGWAWGLPVAAAAVLTFVLITPWLNQRAPRASSAESAVGAAGDSSPARVAIARDPADDTGDNPSLDLMFDLAEVIDLDSDPAPVLAMAADTLDEAVGELSPDEQHEYARLLKESMGPSGV